MPRAIILMAAALLTVAALSTPAPAGEGTLADCVSRCRPDDAVCLDCCAQAFPADSGCMDRFRECAGMCASLTGLKALMCERNCQDAARTCVGQGSVGPFDCPGQVEPQACPDCQTWSPRLQKCVGAPRELCDPK